MLDATPRTFRALDPDDPGRPLPVGPDGELEADDLVGEERRLGRGAVLRDEAFQHARVVLHPDDDVVLLGVVRNVADHPDHRRGPRPSDASATGTRFGRVARPFR